MSNEKKYANFQELKISCRNFVDSSKERGAYDGLKKLLTELYPDKAHFIYELLQNAEDQEASDVKFELKTNCLVFKHNGKKRDFTLEDINSITNIGNSTKSDDPTTIGKFGVGFKAVYAYTNTPEIHSGEYDFKIIDMLVPEDEGVEKRGKKGETEFVFPFNNDNKPADKAVAEIELALKTLNETSILFLNNIRKISYILPNQEFGEISFKANLTDKKFIYAIDIISNNNTQRTWWSKFSSKCPISIDGTEKHYNVSIAYKMINEDKKFSIDSSLVGKVCIYFPTDQNSLLHFHINAPFASTVARDNIQYCHENKMLMDALADLMIGSLYDFKKYHLLDYSVYEALPNQRDQFDNSSRYQVFLDKVLDEFASSSLFIDEAGEYHRKEEIFIASTDVKKVLSLNNVKKLYSRSWVPTFQPTRRIDYFLNQFKIEEYKMEKFLFSLKSDAKFFDEVFNENRNEEYFRHLYYMLSQAKDVLPYGSYNIREVLNKTAILRDVKCFLCEDGELHSISEILFLRTDYIPVSIKNPKYVNLGKDNKERTIEVRAFLISIGIPEMNMQIDTNYELKSYSNIDDYKIKLLEIIEIYKQNKENINQFAYNEFILCKNNEGQFRTAKAKNCCWSKEVAFFYENDCEIKYVVCLEEYEKDLGEEYMSLFREIFIKLGGKVGPEIYRCDVNSDHPQWNRLQTNNIRASSKNIDYSIYGIKQIYRIPEEKLYKESLVLWNVVVNDKNLMHHEAEFAANSSRQVEKIESRVAYYLRRTKWIPNKDGVFCRPCDITADNLYDGFIYNQDAVFLNNLGFGDREKAPDDITTILEEAGVTISAADAEWLRQSDETKAEIIKLLHERNEKKRLSLTEALSNENKEQLEYDEEDDYGRDISIKNPSVRAKQQQEDFEAGLTKRPSVKHILTYTYSSKTSAIEKQFVKEQYRGRCQICWRNPIRKYNGDMYFEAINIVSTSNLDKALLNNIDAGWNTLCLCPTCAAEYRYCSKNLNDFERQVENNDVEANKNEHIIIEIELKGEKTNVKFTPRHFLALKSAFSVYKEHENKKNE